VVSAHGVVGSWEDVTEAGSIFLAAAGPVAVGALAAVGWLLFRRGEGRPTTWTLAGWMLFVYGAWVQVAHLVVDPLLGSGGWMEAIDRFPNRGPVRASMVASGLFVAGLIWKETTRSMAFLVGNGPSAVRRARGGVLARSGWMAGSAILAAAAWPAPMARDAWTAALIAIVGWAPVLAAAARVDQRPVPGAPLQVHLSPIFVLAAVLAGAAVVLVIGPGIEIPG
jgi:hypothetical protein